MSLDDMISRLEAATEGSRELDRLLHNTLRDPDDPITADDVAADPRLESVIRAFTSSLDAAMTLVPEGWAWVVSKNGTATVTTEATDATRYRRESGHATWPALALCIAALKARHAHKNPPLSPSAAEGGGPVECRQGDGAAVGTSGERQ
jgi:hypothetical protein